jgi:hypothetical protein
LNKINRIKAILLLIIALILIFLLVEFIFWRFYIESFPTREDWYSESFIDGIQDWETLDATYLPISHEADGVLQLAKNEYYAPSATTDLNLIKMGQDDFIFHIKVYVTSFLDDSLTLGTLAYSTGQYAIVLNKDNYLGIASNLMGNATYSNKDFTRIKRDMWQDIYLYYKDEKETISLYNGGKLALTVDEQIISMPLTDLWLGSIWIGGKEKYGAPIEIQYDEINISNRGILPKENFWQFLKNQF